MMFRKLDFKFFCRRRSCRLVLLLVVISIIMLAWYLRSKVILTGVSSQVPLKPSELQLRHFKRSRNLSYYLNDIPILFEPELAPCTEIEEPVIIMVASAPGNFLRRQAVRLSWGKFQPTYFVLGLDVDYEGDQLADIENETKAYDDVILFDYLDHYQTLSLKTALMLHWTLAHCPQANFMMKTKDDVMINPNILKLVMEENQNAKLIGHKRQAILLNRNKIDTWYIPGWFYHLTIVPQYLDGCGYLINGKYLKEILTKAHEVPLVSMEDTYFTYLVAYKGLGLSLLHDSRLSPKRPWLEAPCAHWNRALTHGYFPEEMIAVWTMIKTLNDGLQCTYINSLFSSDLLMY